MSASPLSFQHETINAAQGAWRLLIGRRDAPGYFETDLRGLVSSFLAMVISIAVTLAVSAVVRTGGGISSFALIFTNVVLYATLVATSWAVLRVVDKPDRFVPFLAVDNWLNAFISVFLSLTTLVGIGSEVVMFAAIVAGLAARINNARLVAGLGVAQIVFLMVAQVVGVMLGLFVLGLFLPMPGA